MKDSNIETPETEIPEIEIPPVEVPQERSVSPIRKVTKSVRFFPTALVVLIPQTKEYHTANLASELWWTEYEKNQFKEEFLGEMYNYMNQLGIVQRDSRGYFITRDNQAYTEKQLFNKFYDYNFNKAELEVELEVGFESTELDDGQLCYRDKNQYDKVDNDEKSADEELTSDVGKSIENQDFLENDALENTKESDEVSEKPSSCSIS